MVRRFVKVGGYRMKRVVRPGVMTAMLLLLCAAIGSGVSSGQDIPCTFVVQPVLIFYDAYGGTVEVNVTASSRACSYIAKTTWPWITVEPAEGTGSGKVKLIISGNPSWYHRVGFASIGGQDVSVIQYGPRVTGW